MVLLTVKYLNQSLVVKPWSPKNDKTFFKADLAFLWAFESAFSAEFCINYCSFP